MTNHQIVLLIFMISTLISLTYIIIRCVRKQYKQGLIVGGVMMLTPVFGPVLMFVSYIVEKILHKCKIGYLDTSEISFDKSKKKVVLGDDIQRGINKVPIEEALLESNSENARRVLLDILKNDFESSIPILVKAIDSEDSEVSHYASAAISDVLSKFKKNQKMMEEQYQENPEDEELLNQYMEYVYKYLNYDVFPETEFHNYLEVYECLIQAKWERFHKNLMAETILNWITMLVKQGRRDAAEVWLERLQKLYPEKLETYKARLQYSYRYDRKDFVQCIKDIKQSSVDLDEETVEYVRFFQV